MRSQLESADTVRADMQKLESEARFRQMADGAPVIMWISGVDRLCTGFNQAWLSFTGRSLEQEIGNGWVAGVHESDRERCMTVYTDAFDRRVPFSMEYRLRRYDGHFCWVTDAGWPRSLSNGDFAGYIGCCLLIDDHKASEQARLDLTRRLTGAQDEERSRIARELHDGIGQEIALLKIQMQQWAVKKPETNSAIPDIRKFTNSLTAIGSHIARLSHQMHSAELDYLGLEVSVQNLCRQFGEDYPIKVSCSCSEVPRKLDKEISLAFLRIVQESLHNIAKHSGAKEVEIFLFGDANQLVLEVHDDGRGFRPSDPKIAPGLGLVSMRERMYLLGGTFSIDTSEYMGTTVRATKGMA